MMDVVYALLVLVALPCSLNGLANAQTVIPCGSNISSSTYVNPFNPPDASINLTFITGVSGVYTVTTCYVSTATCLIGPGSGSYHTDPTDTQLELTLHSGGGGSARYDNSTELTSNGINTELVSVCTVGGASEPGSELSAGERVLVFFSANSNVTASARHVDNLSEGGYICITVTAPPCGASASPTQPPSTSAPSTRSPTPVPTAPTATAPPPVSYRFACMSGNTEVVRPGLGRSTVANLAVGQRVTGIDEDRSAASCQVLAVEQWGSGQMFGNYTSDHLVVRDGASGTRVETFGTGGVSSSQDKYVVLTDCPAAYDVSGIRFTPMSTHVCGDTPMTWENYVSLYRTYVNLVRTTGTYWTSNDTYPNKTALVQLTPDLCREFFTCAVDGGDCDEFERIARQIVDEQIGDSERNTTLEAFPDLGNASAPGSASEFSKEVVRRTSNNSDDDVIDTTTIIIIVVVGAVVIILVVAFTVVRRSSRSESNHKAPAAAQSETEENKDEVLIVNTHAI
eukprot:m.13017 g.13017  ORF g.13017 m.13017 type:complete len:511 (-) comp2999_c0_seq1:210-1742(-)